MDKKEKTNPNKANANKVAKSANSNRMQGNLDSSYEFDKKDADHYHVRHSRMEKLTSGVVIEDPGSVRFQQYRKEVFEDQILNQEKGLPSIWDNGEALKVVHDPTKKLKAQVETETGAEGQQTEEV